MRQLSQEAVEKAVDTLHNLLHIHGTRPEIEDEVTEFFQKNFGMKCICSLYCKACDTVDGHKEGCSTFFNPLDFESAK